MPNHIISSVEFPRVLLFLAQKGSSKIILKNTDLKKLFNNLAINWTGEMGRKFY